MADAFGIVESDLTKVFLLQTTKKKAKMEG